MFYLSSCCMHLMKRCSPCKVTFALMLALFIPLMAQGCGGGGGGSDSGTVSATVTWTAPAANTDGSPLTDLAGFKIYYWATGNEANPSVKTAAATATQDVVTGLNQNTTYYFEVAAYDTSFNESARSNRIQFH